jgi:IclR family pca regulon transcriptional regulator
MAVPEAKAQAADAPPDRGGQDRNDEFVQSLERGLAVIKAFGPEREKLSLSDVARHTGMTRAAARRFLLTLVELGYVRNDGRDFSLRPRVLELGYAYLSGLTLPDIAAPHMEELVGRLHESSSISVLDGEQIAYVVRVPTKRIMTIVIAVGTRFPAYATSMGRVLLADLSDEDLDDYLRRTELQPITSRTLTDAGQFRAMLAEVARQGYCIVDQELEDGLSSIAVPIRGIPDVGTAAMNVSAHASRVSIEVLRDQFLPELLHTASQIEADVRAQGTR